MPTGTAPSTSRRAIVRLPMLDLAHLIDLPPDLSPVTIFATTEPPAVTLVVAGDSLDEVPVGAEAPLIHGSWARSSVAIDDLLYTRWTWSPVADGIEERNDLLADWFRQLRTKFPVGPGAMPPPFVPLGGAMLRVQVRLEDTWVPFGLHQPERRWLAAELPEWSIIEIADPVQPLVKRWHRDELQWVGLDSPAVLTDDRADELGFKLVHHG